MKDSFSEPREGDDVLLQEIPGGFVAYRAVFHNPPTEADFQSHYELGKTPNPDKPYDSYAWFGVSLFEDREKAERIRRTARKRGEYPGMAILRFPSESGLFGIYRARTSHLEVFATPKELLDLVENVD